MHTLTLAYIHIHTGVEIESRTLSCINGPYSQSCLVIVNEHSIYFCEITKFNQIFITDLLAFLPPSSFFLT